ncbi:MAG: hypothetical protein JXA28_07755 [Bacteroidetes bacterium]|nr:hypothetical protein [Bacteroidota bacterium]
MQKISIPILILILGFHVMFDCTAQQQESIVLQAMKDELQRNIDRLSLEDMSTPFFISYQVKDTRSISIQSTAGAITHFDSSHSRRQNVRVLVGDYTQTQEHFVGSDLAFSMDASSQLLSLEDDYDAIRRELWLSTDRAYKKATETLEKKRAALRQQQMPEEYKDVADFSAAETIEHIEPVKHVTCDIPAWKKRVRELSAILKEYPQLYTSTLTFSFDQSTVYFVNSEGTVTVTPRMSTRILATAATQAEDGEPLMDFILYEVLTPADLPDMEQLAASIHHMAKTLTEKRSAVPMDESYTGPVLFEDQAVPELFTRLYLGSEGLIASRMPIMEGPLAMIGAQLGKRNLGDKIGKRILPNEISIASTPFVHEFQGTELTGTFSVDAEGVQPAEKLLLIDKGNAAALLSDRVPTPHSQASTGHRCLGLGSFDGDGICPGVLDITVSDGPNAYEMKQQLLDLAAEEGLEFAYIVRRIRPDAVTGPSVSDDLSTTISMFGMSAGGGATPLGDPVRIYRVNVADGTETPVRSAEVLKPGASALRKLTASIDREAWNCTMEGDSPIPGFGAFISIGRSVSGASGGIPVSIIAPKAIIISDMEVRKEKRAITPKPPIVESPLYK